MVFQPTCYTLIYPVLLQHRSERQSNSCRSLCRISPYTIRRATSRCCWRAYRSFCNDLVPRSWWGLLLVDASELLSSGTFFGTISSYMKAHASPKEDDMILTINEVHILLARLEEICTKEYFGQGSAGEYLIALRRWTRLESDSEALERLESVRLNFVRYASKCMMSGIDGEGSLLDTPMVI
jgi:nuclear pore complex protein Nup85